jgi:hypothetical protein
MKYKYGLTVCFWGLLSENIENCFFKTRVAATAAI